MRDAGADGVDEWRVGGWRRGGYQYFEHGYCPPQLSQVCQLGANPPCFKYEDYCAKKIKRLHYQRCQVLPPQSEKSCTEYDRKCFLAKKHETLEGAACNSGQPGPCTGEYLGEWYIGLEVSACSWNYVADF